MRTALATALFYLVSAFGFSLAYAATASERIDEMWVINSGGTVTAQFRLDTQPSSCTTFFSVEIDASSEGLFSNLLYAYSANLPSITVEYTPGTVCLVSKVTLP